MTVRLRERLGTPVFGRNMHLLKGCDRLTFVADYYKPGRALDVGSGQGAFAIWLHRQGCQVTMLDIMPIARPILGIEFVQMDLHDMTYEQEFDTILFMEIIEHLLKPADALMLCYRALKPGGVLLITTPWIDRWDGEQDHVWRFNEAGMLELLGSYQTKVWTDHQFVYAVIKKPMKLNLGAGNRPLNGYINIDIKPGCESDIVGDACDLSQFDDDSVDEIRMDAFFEHVYAYKRLKALREWRRVLRPGGKLVINWIPDFEALLDLYGGSGPNEQFKHFDLVMARRILYGKSTDEPSLHKDCFTQEKVATELAVAGFRMIHVHKAVWPGDRPDMPFNICAEAIK